LSTSTLKIIACVTMLMDHVGFYLFPSNHPVYWILRILGRLAFPIFAFCIAIGCRYTRNKLRHFLMILGLGVVCEAVYFLAMGQLEGNILITFSCSILIIYAIQFIKQAIAQKKGAMIALGFAAFVASLGVAYVVARFVGVQYGIYGIAVPAFAVLVDYDEGKAPLFLRRLDKNSLRVFLLTVGLFIYWWRSGFPLVQMFAFLAVIPLSYYNRQPGNKKLKWAFYIFYPAHLVLIWLVGGLIYGF
jgi:hypothetical protein